MNYMFYRAFHRFGQAEIAYGGLVLGLSQFSILPQLPLKMTLASKVVKIDLKIIISRCKSKSVTHSVGECSLKLCFSNPVASKKVTIYTV